MSEIDFIERIETLEKEQDEKICPEAWAEGEVDIEKITVGQLVEYMEVMEKIMTLRVEHQNIPRHVKLMKKAVRIFSQN